MEALLQIQILGGPVPIVVFALAAVCALYLLLRRPTRRRLLNSAIGLLAGTAVALGVYALANRTKAFGGDLTLEVLGLLIATCAAIGLAIVNLWDSRWWRKVVAAVSIPVFALAGGIGINAFYGLDKTVADALGIVVSKPIDLPNADTGDAPPPDRPLYESWQPPADMPAQGKVGTVTIPGAASGFQARQAGLYLPPAAQVKNPPLLPVMVFMLGYPGTPNPEMITPTLDRFAAEHRGLAPIVIIADQIGNGRDPACADSSTYGNAETYIRKDVPAWIRQNLHVGTQPKGWVLGGYSNGGVCAVKYTALDPAAWGTLVAVSPEEFPGVEYADRVRADVYGGDAAAFEADKPAAILARNTGRYAGVTAAVTTGTEDGGFGPGTRRLADAATAAGMNVTLTEIPGAGHTGDALALGLAAGLNTVAPSLGLAPPAPPPSPTP